MIQLKLAHHADPLRLACCQQRRKNMPLFIKVVLDRMAGEKEVYGPGLVPHALAFAFEPFGHAIGQIAHHTEHGGDVLMARVQRLEWHLRERGLSRTRRTLGQRMHGGLLGDGCNTSFCSRLHRCLAIDQHQGESIARLQITLLAALNAPAHHHALTVEH
jgi:hypothetical protein